MILLELFEHDPPPPPSSREAKVKGDPPPTCHMKIHMTAPF